jgi:hypothetical protein
VETRNSWPSAVPQPFNLPIALTAAKRRAIALLPVSGGQLLF